MAGKIADLGQVRCQRGLTAVRPPSGAEESASNVVPGFHPGLFSTRPSGTIPLS